MKREFSDVSQDSSGLRCCGRFLQARGFPRREVSDHEFVESIRGQMQACRRAARFFSVLYGLLLAGVVASIPYFVQSNLARLFNLAAYERGFALGLLIGAAAGFAVLALVRLFVESLFAAFGTRTFRMHRLLIRYYDESAASQKDGAAELK